jgi:hypothetical protein
MMTRRVMEPETRYGFGLRVGGAEGVKMKSGTVAFPSDMFIMFLPTSLSPTRGKEAKPMVRINITATTNFFIVITFLK